MSALESNLSSLSLEEREGYEQDAELASEDAKNLKKQKVKGKHNKHTEPFVLSEDALFMWPEIASFCPPWQVIALETVCTKIRQTLADASVGTRLMNRYWNAQWARLIWGDDEDDVHGGDSDNSHVNNSNSKNAIKENSTGVSNNGNVSKSEGSTNTEKCTNESHDMNTRLSTYDSLKNNGKELNERVDPSSHDGNISYKSEKTESNTVSESADNSATDINNNQNSNIDINNNNNQNSSINTNNSWGSRNSSSSPRESSQRNSIKLVMISRDKKLLLSSSLSHSEGRKDWRTMYRKEYPNWIARTFRGVGIRNNLASEDRARLLHDRGLNEIKTAAQLAREELTVEEALIKKLRKRGITIEIPDSDTPSKNSTRASRSNTRDNSPKSDKKELSANPSSPLKLRGFKNASPVFSPVKGNSKSVNDLVSLPITTSGGGINDTSAGVKGEDKQLTRVAKRYAATREAGSPLTRDDYQCDRRQGARKGKHAKGMPKRWASYNEFGDYDY